MKSLKKAPVRRPAPAAKRPAAKPARAVKLAPKPAARASKPAPKAVKPAAARKPVEAKKPAPPPPPARPAAKPPPPKPPAIAAASLRATAASGNTARTPTTPDLRPGDDLPSLVRGPITRVDGAKFAAAADFWSALSLDEAGAKEAGLPSAVIPGGLAFALASGLVQRWLGLSGRIGKMGARAVKLVWPGDSLTVRGRVVQVEASPEGRRIELDVWVENQKGELILRGQCHALLPGVHLPAPAPTAPEPPAGVPAKGGLDARGIQPPTGPARPRSGR